MVIHNLQVIFFSSIHFKRKLYLTSNNDNLYLFIKLNFVILIVQYTMNNR